METKSEPRDIKPCNTNRNKQEGVGGEQRRQNLVETKESKNEESKVAGVKEQSKKNKLKKRIKREETGKGKPKAESLIENAGYRNQRKHVGKTKWKASGYRKNNMKEKSDEMEKLRD